VIGVHDAVQVDGLGATYCYRSTAADWWCWDELGYATCLGFTYAPPTLSPFSNVSGFSVGGDVLCAITVGGQLECQGQLLGLCKGMDAGAPPLWSGPSGVVSVSAGSDLSASCAVLSTGVVECWGDNTYGTLGDGTTVSRSTPAPVVGISDAVGVTVGPEHVCAWLKDGSARCWGLNLTNALGGGLPPDAGEQLVPVTVQGLTGVVQMGAGCGFTCALLRDGSVWCWGDVLLAGQDGLVSTTSVPLPAQVKL
jgi:alpha-tubulin suppressor-like RCC1 family protein